jgi:ATP-dependent protease ClpP protease subunit
MSPKQLFVSVFFVVFSLFYFPSYGSSSLQPSQLRGKIKSDFSGVLHEHGSEDVTLIGSISPVVLDAFKEIIETESGIKNIYVDSQGGNIISAISIAEIINDHHLHLIVDGKCLSACANFLFVAAETKSVLPFSVVGIHDGFIWYQQNGLEKTASGNEAESLLNNSKDYLAIEVLKKTKLKESSFYQKFGVAPFLHKQFADYISRRKNIFHNENHYENISYESCPAIKTWVLDEAKLRSIGIKGILEFWYPKDNKERLVLSSKLNIDIAAIYFGDSGNLELMCTDKFSRLILEPLYSVLLIVKKNLGIKFQ